MTTPNDPTMSHDSLDAVIADYILAVEAGAVPNRQELLDQHAEHADALRAFFADLDRMDRVASPLRVAGGPDETGAADANGQTALSTVRYFGDYELLEEIARGGMGIVYKARQVSLNRLVALKMILAGSFASTRDIQRFRSEAEAAANLDHPQIVPIYEIGEHEGQQYYSMKFVEGTSLAKHARGNPRSEVEGLVGVIRAVHHAHQRGVLHRDLKPSNVLVDSQGALLVTDFGLAKRLAPGDSSFTETGQMLGTPKYMAPEQAAGRKDLTVAADVYSLGVILYERLAGQTPFTGDNALTVLRQARESDPPRPSTIRPGLDRDLETVVLKCLEKDSHRRYPSADALAEDLRRWLVGEPILARRVSRPERIALWCRRNPSLAVASSLALAALVAVAVISLVFAVEQTNAKNRVKGLADNLKAALKDSEQRAAALNFERGHALCEKGEMGPGLLWLVESWRSAVAADNTDWQHTARASLSAWQRHPAQVKAVFSQAEAVSHVAFSSDGKAVLTGSEDGTAQLWDARTAKPLGPTLRHDDAITDLTFSPDGKTALIASWDGTVRLLDSATGQPLRTLLHHQSPVYHAAFSPDGNTVLTGSYDAKARLWNVATGRPLGSPLSHRIGVWAVAFSPDGKTVLTGSGDRTARLWDTATGNPLGPPLSHRDDVRAVAFSSDGKTVLTGSQDKTARLWDGATGQPVGPSLVHQGGVHFLAFSPDGKTLLTRSDHGIARLWDAATGRPLGAPLGHRNDVRAVAFSPDGKTVLTGSEDGTARLWDAATGRPVGLPIRHLHPVLDVAFGPDDKTVLTGDSGGTARLWDTTTVQPHVVPLSHERGARVVAFSPDGKAVLTGGGFKETRLWDAATGQPLGPPFSAQGGTIAQALSPDGKAVLLAGTDETALHGRVQLRDGATGQPLGSPLSLPNLADVAAFRSDGKAVLIGTRDGTARVWDAASGRPLGPPLSDGSPVHAVAFSPDGKAALTGGGDKRARIWDVATGRLLGPLLTHQGGISAVAFSPDGKVALTGSDDKTARLWDAATGRPLGPSLIHEGGVSAVAFSHDGKEVLTGSRDKTARLWDAATGRPLGPPMSHESWISAVAFTPDGKAVLTGDADGTAQLWDVSELADNPERISTWVEVITGLKLEKPGSVSVLDNSSWRQRRDMLNRLGGPPPVDSAWAADPILFGPEPTARARAWIERQRWAEAEAAFDEVVLARPFDADVVLERARFLAAHSRPDKADDDFLQAYALGSHDPDLIEMIVRNEALFARAVARHPDSFELWSRHGDDRARRQRWAEAAADYGQLVRLQPEDLTLRHHQILLLGAAGEIDQLQRARFDLLSRFGRTGIAHVANSASWCCSLAPGMNDRLEVLVRLAELAVNGFTADQKHLALNTLGATLYRAGRFDDALRRLEEGMKARNGAEEPFDWPFLAMAHHCLGHHDEARRWLYRLCNHQPNTSPHGFWQELEFRLLRSEAEAVILYDPVFPADPFAH